MNASSSRLLSCNSLIACVSWGVSTSCWLWRMLREGPKPIASRSLQREALAEVEAPDLLVGDQRFGSTLEQHLTVVDDASAVDDVERLADIVVGDQNADVAVLELAHEVADVGDGNRIDSGERLIEQH